MSTDKADTVAAGRFARHAVLLIGASAVLAWGLSLVVIPALTSGDDGFFGSICRAIGLPIVTANGKAVGGMSAIVLDAPTLNALEAGDMKKGAQIAEDYCIGCHNINGMSSDPASVPTLTGQQPRAMYKQLWDIKTGARANEAMQPIVADLSDEDIRAVVSYYASLPGRNRDFRDWPAVSRTTVDLITKGDASRALPACASCHDERTGGPIEAPLLLGQYPAYLEVQLRRYASGERKNDLFARMRNIAAKLTDQETKEVAKYYDQPIADGFKPRNN